MIDKNVVFENLLIHFKSFIKRIWLEIWLTLSFLPHYPYCPVIIVFFHACQSNQLYILLLYDINTRIFIYGIWTLIILETPNGHARWWNRCRFDELGASINKEKSTLLKLYIQSRCADLAVYWEPTQPSYFQIGNLKYALKVYAQIKLSPN